MLTNMVCFNLNFRFDHVQRCIWPRKTDFSGSFKLLLLIQSQLGELRSSDSRNLVTRTPSLYFFAALAFVLIEIRTLPIT